LETVFLGKEGVRIMKKMVVRAQKVVVIVLNVIMKQNTKEGYLAMK
jgi:hypothetical protein